MKPANIALRPDGHVKVLDFGLAKALAPVGDGSGLASTVTVAESVAGSIGPGTPAYMSPEQARGLPVDTRTDVWAFGCVLYELLTGERPFTGKTVTDVLAQILERDPDLGALPPPLKALVEKCLRKDPRGRWRSIGDVRLLLEDAHSGAASVDSPMARAPSGRAPMFAAAACALGLAVMSALYLGQDELQVPTTRFTVPIPGDALEDAGSSLLAPAFALSPDGRTLAIASAQGNQRRLWVRSLDVLRRSRVAGHRRRAVAFLVTRQHAKSDSLPTAG